jgi:hypothetical protein
MGGTADFVGAVDAFMAAPKELVIGSAGLSWHRARDEGAKRLKLPLEVGGEQLGQYLLIDAFPEYHSLKFCLGIVFMEHVVCRLDFDPDATHGNAVDDWSPLPKLIRGPHWHSWELNRDTFKQSGTSNYLKLPLASAYEKAKRFDAALRWYCAERHIPLGDHGIELPPPDRLL